MGKIQTKLSDALIKFIEQQPLFFVATAPVDGRINLSPKGLDSIRIISENQLVWLNFTGSGNETAAHLMENQRITLMFCAFEGNPLILRIYGSGKVLHRNHEHWDQYSSLFQSIEGARQFILVDIESIQTSCGFGVPLMDFNSHRTNLPEWCSAKGDDKIKDYWKSRNSKTIDDKDTEIHLNL